MAKNMRRPSRNAGGSRDFSQDRSRYARSAQHSRRGSGQHQGHYQQQGAQRRPYEQVQHSNGASYGSRGGTGNLNSSGKLQSIGGATYSRNASRYTQGGKRRRNKKLVTGIICVLIVALIACGTAAALYMKHMDDLLGGNQDIKNLVTANSGEPYYVLLLGGDSREGTKEDNRSDSMMVARIDEANKKVSLVSIPRDLRVNMGEHGYQKINAAIEYGGYDYVIEIVNNVLNIKISHYAFIYFDGFEDLVDKLGGVKVKVPEGTYYKGVSVPAGDNVEINGKEALVLARCRHGNPPDQGAYAMGDYQRTLNQRNLIKAIGKKILASDVTAMPSLIEGLASCVDTSFSTQQIISLAQNMKGMDTDDMETEQLPIAGATVNGAWTGVLYNDVFEVMRDNFISGNAIMEGLDNFNEEYNDDNVGQDYTDGPVYSYTLYKDKYGEFRSSSSSSSTSSSSSSSSSSS